MKDYCWIDVPKPCRDDVWTFVNRYNRDPRVWVGFDGKRLWCHPKDWTGVLANVALTYDWRDTFAWRYDNAPYRQTLPSLA